jgi:hypothetical protein
MSLYRQKPDEALKVFRVKKIEKSIRMVARDRIELPTQGFSVPCSTD